MAWPKWLRLGLGKRRLKKPAVSKRRGKTVTRWHAGAHAIHGDGRSWRKVVCICGARYRYLRTGMDWRTKEKAISRN